MPQKKSIKQLKEPQISQSLHQFITFPENFEKRISNPQKINKAKKNHLKIKSVGDLDQYQLIPNQYIPLELQSYFYNKINDNLFFSDQQFYKNSKKNVNTTFQNQLPDDFMLNLPSFNKNSIATTESYNTNSKNNKLNDYQFYEQNSIISFFNEQKQILSTKDFDILNYCGEGVYGSVYKAKHLASNCIFALKKIQKSNLIDEVQKQALKNQAKIHNKLNHPNIVKFYDFFSNENSIYFVLELCNDGNLYEILKEKKRFSQKQTRKIIFQICNALNYLHKKNIIHRDIKAQNIVIHQNVAKICDFGWATVGGTSRKILCGTPAYISPEIIQQKLYDKKVDVWSMGILIFELIYGYLPFRIHSQNDLQKIVTDELQFPQSINVSQNCKDFILKCLQKQAKYRWDIESLLKHPFLKRSTDA